MNSLETFLNTRSTGMRRAVPFVKMQGLGNDFVVIHESDLTAAAEWHDGLPELPADPGLLAKTLCDRHFGIGADGLIFVQAARQAECDFKWAYFNADGKETICGNGLRCVALYAVHTGLVGPGNIFIESIKGPLSVIFTDSENIETDLGAPELAAESIPFGGDQDDEHQAKKRSLKTTQGTFTATCVSLGNPHCVMFFPDLPPKSKMLAVAQELQSDRALFPEGVNVEFVSTQSPNHATVYVVERGCGPTLACGTGAAAVQVAGVLDQMLDRACDIKLPGGILRLSWSDADNHVRIKGPAAIAFEGVFDLAQYCEEVKPS